MGEGGGTRGGREFLSNLTSKNPEKRGVGGGMPSDMGVFEGGSNEDKTSGAKRRAQKYWMGGGNHSLFFCAIDFGQVERSMEPRRRKVVTLTEVIKGGDLFFQLTDLKVFWKRL